MAAKTLEELIGSLSADERKLFETTLDKNPDLKGGWLRQDDYSRKTQELKAKESEYLEAVEYKQKMEPWSDTAYERIHSLEEAGVIDGEGNVLYIDERKRLQSELDEAKRQALAGGDMDPKELDRRVQEIVKQNGGATSEEVKALVASEARRMTEEAFDAKYQVVQDGFNKTTIPFVWGGAAALASAVNTYERETGKEFTDEDTDALFKVMSETKNFDARKAIRTYMKPQVEAKERDAEVKRLVQEELARRGMPGGGDEPYIPQPIEKGNLRQMMERQDGGNDVESVIRAAAVKAAGELQAEGKS